jgi:hypothetical protein
LRVKGISRTLFCLFLAFGLLAGCAGARKDTYIYPFPRQIKGKKAISRLRDVISGIRERNSTVENSPEWIERSYLSFMFRNLEDIPEEEYSNYAKYARGGRVFVIVHPAFYTFFTVDKRFSLKDEESVEGVHPDNVVERFYKRTTTFDDNLRIMQEQEKVLRDFIEVLSTENILIVFILPKDYKENLNKGVTGERDEYARFLNEIANESDSVVYLYSRKVDRGDVERDKVMMLIKFFQKTGVRTIDIGGGYIGRCLAGFYDHLTDNIYKKGIENEMTAYVVPEIAAVSPVDLRGYWSLGLLAGPHAIDYNRAAKNLAQYRAYDIQKVVPTMQRFYIYEFEFDEGE